LADLRIFLSGLTPEEMPHAVADMDVEALPPVLGNYVAATVEGVARQKRLPSPSWVRQIEPLHQPHFAWELQSLRPHLMRITPLTFKRRNVFVDAAGIEISRSARSSVKVQVPGPHLPTGLELLNAELVRLSVECELCAAGGAIINVVFSAEPTTRRITALFRPERLLREGAASVGAARGLGRRWLPETVRRYLAPGVDGETFLELSNLRVYVGQPEYLLAMKCAALRLGKESEGRVDIRYLLRYLNLSTADEALGVVDRYFGERQLPADIGETLQLLLSA
jgi:hypothetical protein